MKVRIKALERGAKTPHKKITRDFCYDVYATSCEQISEKVWKYGLGIAAEMDIATAPEAFRDCIFSLDFRPRSSIVFTGFVLANCEGTVDELYRGEISAYFYKVAEGDPYKVGDRILQCKVGITLPIEWEWSDNLSETERGEGGFGSTGKR